MAAVSTSTFFPLIGQINDFHFYSACGQSVPWPNSWYNEPFFTVSRAHYDSIASTGQVDPPPSIYLTEGACTAVLASISSASVASASSAAITASYVSASSLSDQSIASLISASPEASRSIASVSSVSVASTSSASRTAVPSSTASLPVATGTVTSRASSAPTPSSTSRPPSDEDDDRPPNEPSCAGVLDPQATENLSAAVWSILAGLLVWIAFALLRGRLPTIYEPRRWFIQPDDRPNPVHASLLTFLFPPIPLIPSLGSSSTTDDHLAIRTIITALLIVGLWSTVGLAVALPLYVVSTSCISTTSPRSVFGGALSSMNDLSILRLLNAIDPSTAVTPSSTPSALTSKRSLLSLVTHSFASATDAIPASSESSNARTRLLALVIILPLLTVLPALFSVSRAFFSLTRFRHRFLEETCDGMEIGFVACEMDGLGEELLRRRLREGGLMRPEGEEVDALGQGPHEGEASDEKERKKPSVDVVGVFAVPDVRELDALVKKRATVLDQLERSETQYITSFTVDNVRHADEEENGHGMSMKELKRSRRGRLDSIGSHPQAPPSSFVAPSSYYRLKPTSSNGSRADEHGINQPSEHLRTSQQDLHASLGPGRATDETSPFMTGTSAPPTPSTAADPSTLRLRGGSAVPMTRLGPQASTASLGGVSFASVSDHPAALASDRSRRATMASIAPLHDRISARDGDAPNAPGVRPRGDVTRERLSISYEGIRTARSELKRLNAEVEERQASIFDDIAHARGIKGYLLMGRGVRFIHGIRLIEGMTKEDIIWEELLKGERARPMLARTLFYGIVLLIAILLAGACLPFLALGVADAPGLNEYLPVLRSIARRQDAGSSIAKGLVPAIAISLLIALAVVGVNVATRISGAVSYTRRRLVGYQAICTLLLVVCGAWLVAAASLLSGMQGLATGENPGRGVADGSIFSSSFFHLFLVNAALIAPGLQLLQPIRLYKVLRALRKGATPRERFRASLPRNLNLSYSASVCVLAVFYAAVFSLLFPLLGIPAFLLLLLSLIAMRYIVYYNYARTRGGQSGGLFGLWTLRRFGFLLAAQPILFGLILESRGFRNYAIAMWAVAAFAILFLEIYTARLSHRPTARSLPSETRQALADFRKVLSPRKQADLGSSPTGHDPRPPASQRLPSALNEIEPVRARRASNATILDLMVSLGPNRDVRKRSALPLKTETIDDLVSTELAARTRVDAPPHLAPLAFADPADELRGYLYPPSLLAPPPVIWLPDDAAGVGRIEVAELGRYHSLSAISSPR